MQKDKLLERFLKQGTVTTSINSAPATPKHAAVDQSIFQPKKLVGYNRNTAIGSSLNIASIDYFPTQTFPGSTVTVLQNYLTTEDGAYLLTEDNYNLEIE